MYNYKEGALLRVLFDLGMFASTISCGIDSIYIYIYIYTIKLSEYHKGQLLVILIIVFIAILVQIVLPKVVVPFVATFKIRRKKPQN